MTFSAEVTAEVTRATRLFPGQEQTLTLAEWLAVLTEEVGEVAREINDAHFGDMFDHATLDRIRAELVQVGAMAARMAASAEHHRKDQL